MRSSLRAAIWLLSAAATLVAGFVIGVIAFGVAAMLARGEITLTEMQALFLRFFIRHVVLDGLLPLLVATGLTWVVLVRAVPRIDRRWLSISAGLVVVAALWFPVVGRYSFAVWQPVTPWDYANTLALMAGGVTVALLLPRRFIGAFAPGRL